MATNSRARHRIFIALAFGWLFAASAPCVMAAAACTSSGTGTPCSHTDGATPAAMAGCDAPATFDCASPDETPPSAAFDVIASAPMPVVLAMLPVTVYLPEVTGLRQHMRDAAGVVHPPLNLQHAVLLI